MNGQRKFFKQEQIPWHICHSGHHILFISVSTVLLPRVFIIWLKIIRYTKKQGKNTLLPREKIYNRTRPTNNLDLEVSDRDIVNTIMNKLKDLVLKKEMYGWWGVSAIKKGSDENSKHENTTSEMKKSVWVKQKKG